MQDSGGVHEHDAVGAGKLTRLIELGEVQGDGLLAKHVLARSQAGAQVGDVGVVRGGDVDDVHVRVGKNVLWPVVDLGNAVLCGECHRLFVGAVCHSVEGLSTLCHCLRQFMSDDTAA